MVIHVLDTPPANTGRRLFTMNPVQKCLRNPTPIRIRWSRRKVRVKWKLLELLRWGPQREDRALGIATKPRSTTHLSAGIVLKEPYIAWWHRQEVHFLSAIFQWCKILSIPASLNATASRNPLKHNGMSRFIGECDSLKTFSVNHFSEKYFSVTLEDEKFRCL